MSQPATTFLEDEHIHVWADLDLKLTMERFRDEHGDLKADVTPESVAGTGDLPPEKLNLSSARSIKMYANTLGGHGMLQAEAWFECLSQASRISRERHRTGDPKVYLADVEWRGRARFVIYPLIEARGTTIWFGDGGVSKSMHALAAAVSVATGIDLIPNSAVRMTGPVVYADWEADPETHAERLEALCVGAGIEVPRNIIYLYRSASLADSVRELRRAIALEGAVFSVVDSVGAASGGDPESAEAVIRSMNAIRALKVPTLALHHVTKDQRDKTKPFGSVYSPNLARLTWRLDKEQDEDSSLVRVRLTNFKGNNVGLMASKGHGLRLNGSEGDEGSLEEVTFSQVSGLSLPPPGGKKTIKYEVARVLREIAGLTLEELAEKTGEAKDSIARTLRRETGWFTKHEDLWYLVGAERTDISSLSGAGADKHVGSQSGLNLNGQPDKPDFLSGPDLSESGRISAGPYKGPLSEDQPGEEVNEPW